MPLVAVPQFLAQIPTWTIAQLGEEDQVEPVQSNSIQSRQLHSNQLQDLAMPSLQGHCWLLMTTFLPPRSLRLQACSECGGRTCARRSSISLQVEVPRQVTSNSLTVLQPALPGDGLSPLAVSHRGRHLQRPRGHRHQGGRRDTGHPPQP